MGIPPSLEAAFTAYLARIRSHFGERFLEARLFGSYARGEARPDSDVDVAVILRGPITHAERVIPMGLAGDIVLEFDFAFSPIVLTSDELDFLRAREDILATTLDREGIRL